MTSEEIDQQCGEMYSRRLAERAGLEIQVWHRLENGSYQQMFITDVMGVVNLYVFVKPNPAGRIW